jgi:hypothetical protein
MSHINIRPRIPSDDNFIYNSWLASMKGDQLAPKSKFFGAYRDQVNDLLARCEVAVACDPQDETFIHGYIVYKKADGLNLVHWAYTKAPFRRLNVMTDLLKSVFQNLGSEQLVITYKHESRYPKMYEKFKMVYRPEYRSLKV